MNELALAFRKRYNRHVVVDVLKNSDTNKEVRIKYRDFVFNLSEHLTDGMTQYVDVTHEGKVNRLKTYLEAEVFVADKIGEK